MVSAKMSRCVVSYYLGANKSSGLVNSSVSI